MSFDLLKQPETRTSKEVFTAFLISMFLWVIIIGFISLLSHSGENNAIYRKDNAINAISRKDNAIREDKPVQSSLISENSPWRSHGASKN
ncbi:MAG TPA: hypothetical protein VHT73_14195 [Thermodesulfobacteriota bacterium]|nr:hypothetical protein [Thermodesulfobacteriota bacterium]